MCLKRVANFESGCWQHSVMPDVMNSNFDDTLIFIMIVFFFLYKKKTQVQIPEPKRTGLVFVLSVQYEYSLFFMLEKRQSL